MKSNSLEVLKASFNLPLLTREQEIALFQQFQRGGPDAQSAREKLFLHNIRLVSNIAKSMYPKEEFVDKMQWGMIGLDKAIDRFKIEKKCKFSTFAMSWIKQIISRETGNSLTVCGLNLPAHLLADYNKMVKVIENEKVEPSVESIINHPKMMRKVKGKRVKMTESKAVIILMLLKRHGRAVSLDEEVVFENRGGTVPRGEFLPDKKAEAAFDAVINQQIIDSLLVCLTPTQRLVIAQCYLVDSSTLCNVSKQIGLSPERVRQILSASLKRMLKQANKLGISPP